jgi:hypothetical protein
MGILEFQKNTYLVAVYYNHRKSNLFKIHVDVTLDNLKHQLSQFNGRLHTGVARRVTDVEYRHGSYLQILRSYTLIGSRVNLTIKRV